MNIIDIKQNNRKRIYFFLRERLKATKQDIAYNLQLSLPTVTQNLTYLAEQDLISSESKIANKVGGRNPVAYSYIPEAKVAIGLDITRHHVKSVISDLDGNIIKYVYRRREYQRTEAYLQMLGQEVEAIILSSGVERSKILGVGIAVPGLIDHEKEYVVDGRVIDNTGMTRRGFSKYIPFDTKLIHDSDAAGYSEMNKNQTLHNACYLNLCGSIGGSVFFHDNVYLGDGLYSCEFGHLNLVPNGRRCYCGQKGCFDPYLNSEVLSQLTDGNLFTFFEKVDQGELAITSAWDDYLDNLATLVTEIRMMFGSSIIIGGDIGAYIDKHMNTLRSKVDGKSPFGEKAVKYLMPCVNKNEAIATGAARYFTQEFLESALVMPETSEFSTD
ncbi:MAG: ROK family transcriptional regulator [Eubacteriales bacterium]|nr:ROK family transcriptional regulator [Eubacteriales bacterium]